MRSASRAADVESRIYKVITAPIAPTESTLAAEVGGRTSPSITSSGFASRPSTGRLEAHGFDPARHFRRRPRTPSGAVPRWSVLLIRRELRIAR